MKNNIFPNWEDPENRCGGCLSFKILSSDIKKQWNELFLHFITNNLDDEINGISISPKKEFNIIKIWIKNDNPNFKIKEINNFFLNKNARYKKHDIVL